jgi:glycosyltransferase involved in cell wall biosynthesis
MPNPWTDVHASIGWLQDIARQVAPDCIHFNHFAYAGMRWDAPTVAVAHSCVWSWWQAVHGTTPGAEFEQYYAMVKAGVHGADRVVTPSADMLANIIRDYGLPHHANVIPNGIELERFAPRTKLPYVLAAGRLWDEAKNIRLLQQVAPELSWPVYVAGESLEPRGVAAEGGMRATACRPLGLLDRPGLMRCLARAAIYAHPARYEPFGLSVLEAAASGCALVLGRIPSLVENWHSAACFVDPNDPSALRDMLEHLIAHPGERDHWSARARQRATKLSAQRMAAHYAQTYAELAARRTGSIACAS